jgi:hypothetical protein
MWISTNVTNIYLASIRFGTLQYLCNTLYKSQHIPAVLGFLRWSTPLPSKPFYLENLKKPITLQRNLRIKYVMAHLRGLKNAYFDKTFNKFHECIANVETCLKI